MSFKIGETYSRAQISQQLGGNHRWYLPVKNNKVVCGCFTRSDNPAAPEEVLFGPGPKRQETAQLVFEQGKRGQAIPIFIFEDTKQWRFLGKYRCVGLSQDSNLIRAKMAKYPNHGKIVGVLYFAKSARSR